MGFILMGLVFACISWTMKDHGGEAWYFIALFPYLIAIILFIIGAVDVGYYIISYWS